MEILGGQAVQARRLLAALAEEPGVALTFQPINPSVGPLRRIKYLRTAASIVLYCAQMLARSRRYDVLHVFSASYYSYTLRTLPALACAKLYGKKIILNYRDGQAERHLANWRTALPSIRRMDAVVAPSGYLVDVFAGFGIQAQAIFNILDPRSFRHRKRRRLRPVFLHNRILEPLYNVGCALRAFQLIQQRYSEASLTVAHDGGSRPELEQLARELGLANTRFVGQVPHDRVADLYDQSDIYLTSPDFDCMPGSLLECFASGLPVVATDAGGIPYIAENERTALLVPRGDHQAMAAAALRLLEDQDLVERLTAAAYEESNRYDASVARREWAALYRRLHESR